MTNPWLKKNPLMSMWLSSFHTVANTARARASAEFQRQSEAMLVEASRQWFRFWTAGLPAHAPRKRSSRRKRR